MDILINPGAGPVKAGSYKQACENLRMFAADCEIGLKLISTSAVPDDGRYSFVIADHYGYKYEIEMPGLPLDKVRYMGEEGQNVFEFPRLYVDGSSWIWNVAVGLFSKESIKERIQEEIEEKEYEIERLRERLNDFEER